MVSQEDCSCQGTEAKSEMVLWWCATKVHGMYWIRHKDMCFLWYWEARGNYFSLTLFDNCLLVSFKEALPFICWGPDEIQPLHLLSLTPSPEPLLLDLNHLACYIVRSDVNNSLLLKGLTSLKFINEFGWKKKPCWVWRYSLCLPSCVLNAHHINHIGSSFEWYFTLGAFSAPIPSTLLNYSETVHRESLHMTVMRELIWHIVCKISTP